MLSIATCLKFDKIKKDFSLTEDGDELFKFFVKISVKGDTGKEFPIKATVIIRKPPEEFPDHAIIVSREFSGRGVSKYYQDCHRKLNRELEKYKIPFQLSLEKKNYLGLIEEKGGKYRPFIFDPKEEEYGRVAEETVLGGDKYIYFRINEKYYYAQANPLADVTSGKVEEKLKELKRKLQENFYYIGSNNEMRQKMPEFLYKGYAPIYYLGNEIGFTKDYKNFKSIITPGDKKYRTLKRFLYAFKQNEQEIRSKIRIFDETLNGEELKAFSIGDEVKVISKEESKKPIFGFEGKVVNQIKDRIYVQFFNYFQENFDPNELEKTCL